MSIFQYADRPVETIRFCCHGGASAMHGSTDGTFDVREHVRGDAYKGVLGGQNGCHKCSNREECHAES